MQYQTRTQYDEMSIVFFFFYLLDVYSPKDRTTMQRKAFRHFVAVKRGKKRAANAAPRWLDKKASVYFLIRRICKGAALVSVPWRDIVQDCKSYSRSLFKATLP